MAKPVKSIERKYLTIPRQPRRGENKRQLWRNSGEEYRRICESVAMAKNMKKLPAAAKRSRSGEACRRIRNSLKEKTEGRSRMQPERRESSQLKREIISADQPRRPLAECEYREKSKKAIITLQSGEKHGGLWRVSAAKAESGFSRWRRQRRKPSSAGEESSWRRSNRLKM